MLFILKLLSSSLSGAPFPLKIYCLNDKTPPTYVENIKTSKAAARYTKHFKLKSIHLKQTWTIHTFPLQRPLSVELNFFKINSIFKVKCSLKAELFKRKLRRIPLIKLCENGPRTMLKGRAFE